MKLYWFYIDSYVYSNKTKSKLLLYNTLSKKVFQYEQLDILALHKAMENENGIIRLSEEDLINKNVNEFVQKVKKHFCGDLLEITNNSKPVIVKSNPVVNRDYRKKIQDNSLDFAKNVLNNLHEISIYINTNCKVNDCQICNIDYQQVDCCSNKYNGKEIDINKLKPILKVLDKYPFLNRVKIYGKDLNNYSQIQKLKKLLGETRKTIEFIFNIKQIELSDLRSFEYDNFIVKIIISGHYDLNIVKDFISKIGNFRIGFHFHFLIEDEDQLNIFNSALALLKNYDYTVSPIVNGESNTFLEENVYITIDDIFDSKPEMKTIHTNQILNSNFFGKLTILPTGEIYDHINGDSMGHIEENIADVVYRTILKSKYWFMIRSECDECTGCVFNEMCPPISNYELFLKKNNLCKVN